MDKRTIIVGDVHGCLDEFRALVERVGYRQGTDRLIVAGDLVDRGPDSAGVVRYAMEIGAEAVQGNHDAKLLRRRKHMLKAQINANYRNPMYPDADQERTISQLGDSEIAWLEGLPYYIELPEHNALVVHAGFAPGVPLHRQNKETMTMVRYIHPETHRMMALEMPGFRQPAGSVFWADLWDDTRDVIFGHNVVGREGIRVWKGTKGAGCYGIDTGCVFGGRLTAMIMAGRQEREVVQVSAAREYSEYTKH
jgi:bis(5'-nucleosyl)-tetraphosphatase (symmetrical)